MHIKSLKIFENDLYRNALFIVTIFIVSRILTWSLGYCSYKLLEDINSHRYVWNYVQNKKIDIWGVWDSGYYIDIAENGYSREISTEQSTFNQANYAFYPLYPTLLKVLNLIFHNTVLSGIILSNISLFVASIFLFLLVKREYGDITAKYSILFLLSFPTAFVLTSVYSEALFLALSIGCFYYGKDSKFLKAGILGLLASITRNLGFFLIVPLLYLVYKEKVNIWNKMSHLMYILLVPFGTLCHMIYIRYLTGNYFSAINIQNAWGRTLGSPLRYIINGLQSDLPQHKFTATFVILIFLLLMIGIKLLKREYLVYSFLLFLIPLLTGLASMPRYILVIFPIFIIEAIIAKRNAYIGNILLISSAMTQGMMLVFWASGFDLLM